MGIKDKIKKHINEQKKKESSGKKKQKKGRKGKKGKKPQPEQPKAPRANIQTVARDIQQLRMMVQGQHQQTQQALQQLGQMSSELWSLKQMEVDTVNKWRDKDKEARDSNQEAKKRAMIRIKEEREAGKTHNQSALDRFHQEEQQKLQQEKQMASMTLKDAATLFSRKGLGQLDILPTPPPEPKPELEREFETLLTA